MYRNLLPSLSLLCLQAFAAQVENFLGSDVIEPPLQFPPGPPPPGFDAPPLEFFSWSEIAQVCGDSRLWGGMHFEASPVLCPPNTAAVSWDGVINALLSFVPPVLVSGCFHAY